MRACALALLVLACGDSQPQASGGAGGHLGSDGSGGAGGAGGSDASAVDAPAADAPSSDLGRVCGPAAGCFNVSRTSGGCMSACISLGTWPAICTHGCLSDGECGPAAPHCTQIGGGALACMAMLGNPNAGCFPPDASSIDAAPACNPATQSGCPNASNPKCAIEFPDPQSPGIEICTMGGTVPPGGACVRRLDSTGLEIAGDDNCANGYCSVFDAPQDRQCRRYCDVATESANCTSSERCFLQAEPYGLCRRTCDPFGSMSQCPQNNTLGPRQACSWQLLVGETASDAFCDVIGATVAAGGACNPFANPPQDCLQGNICLGDNICHALCDATGNHNCPVGQTCLPAQYLSSDGQTVIVAPGPNMGGWCFTQPDAGAP